MPPFKVRDKLTGKVDTIDWNGSRPPTRDEVLRALHQKEGSKPFHAGAIPDNVAAPIPSPNAGQSSPENKATFNFRPSTTEGKAQPSGFKKIVDTMWGGDDSVLPPVPGITRPLLPQADRAGTKRMYEALPDDPEANAIGPELGTDIYENIIRPSSSAIGAASDWATGKVVGPLVEPVVKYGKGLFGKAASMFGRKAPAVAAEVAAPAVAARAPQKLLPERAASASRYAVDEKGLITDLERPYSKVEQKPFDPHTPQGPSGVVNPTTGVVVPSRDRLGKFVKQTSTSTHTVKPSEIPNVDIPPEIQAAYPRQIGETKPPLANVPPPGVRLSSSQQSMFRKQAEERGSYLGKQHQLSPTDEAVRSGPTTVEYVGQPGVNKKPEGPVTRSWQTPRPGARAEAKKVAAKQAAIDRAAEALKASAKGVAPKKVKAAANEIRGYSSSNVTDTAADMGRDAKSIFDQKPYTVKEMWQDTKDAVMKTYKGEKIPYRKPGEEMYDYMQRTGLPSSVAMRAPESLTGRTVRRGHFPGDENGIVRPPKDYVNDAGLPDVHPPVKLKKPTASEVATEVANIPRSIMSSIDASAPLRQGAGLIHKKEFWKALPDMFKAMGSEESFEALQASIRAHPDFNRARKAKLALTDLGKQGKREELFMSNYAEKIPVLGKAIRASGRGYVGFLNKVRMDVFSDLTEKAAKAGANVDPKVLARFVNTASGRGNLGKSLERSVPILNATLFSPRLMKSRIDMLNPYYYYKLDPFTRKEALKSLAAIGGAAGTTLGLAHAAGAEVELDPRSSDFAKIKIGNTRLDIGAGFQQYIRLGAQMITGERKDLETGRIKELGKGYRDASRKDVLYDFMESKAAPIASFMVTMAEGRTFTGEKAQALPNVDNITDWTSGVDEVMKSEVGKRLTPMITQDLIDLYKEDPELMWMAFPATFGSSIQVHKARTAKRPQ